LATIHGIDFIICDHHLPDAQLPPAVAILNPRQIDCTYPYKELCGCGVGFKLITALSMDIGLPEESYYCYLDLVATAIAADIVPMTGENRILAYYGLKRVNENPCAGIKALIDALNIVYEEEEKRGLFKLNLVALAFTVGAILLLLFAIGAVVALPLLFDRIGLGRLTSLLIALGLTNWSFTCRIARASALSLKSQGYVQAARVLGYGDLRIMITQLLPNMLGPIIVIGTLGMGSAVLSEAALSFLGLGVRPPYPSWGSMLSEARDQITTAPWLSIFPGLAIFLTVLGLNLLGDGLRDILDPQSRSRRT